VTFSRRVATLAAVALLATTACSDDDSLDTSADTTTPAAADVSTTDAEPTTTEAPTGTGAALDGDLPPPGPFDIEPIYGEALAELGLRLTSQGGLIDRSDGGYAPSADGDHLAIYVEPIGDYTVADYIEGIHTVAVVFQDVFQRWPGLATYDVCQEPGASWSSGNTRSLPVTQIELTREEAAALGPLDDLTVVDLLRAAKTDPPGLALRVGAMVVRDPGYQALLAQAEA
jgi:hypothetical protein